jgi:hypothetical protein
MDFVNFCSGRAVQLSCAGQNPDWSGHCPSPQPFYHPNQARQEGGIQFQFHSKTSWFNVKVFFLLSVFVIFLAKNMQQHELNL